MPSQLSTPDAPSALRLTVIGAKPGTMVDVMPGRKFAALGLVDVETMCLAEMVPAGDGTFRPVARICPRMWGNTAKNLRRLGIAISTCSMVRLITAGFVKGHKITPALYQFDYFSYLEHEAAVQRDPEFWEKREPGQQFTNLVRFRQAIKG